MHFRLTANHNTSLHTMNDTLSTPIEMVVDFQPSFPVTGFRLYINTTFPLLDYTRSYPFCLMLASCQLHHGDTFCQFPCELDHFHIIEIATRSVSTTVSRNWNFWNTLSVLMINDHHCHFRKMSPYPLSNYCAKVAVHHYPRLYNVIESPHAAQHFRNYSTLLD